MFFQQKKQLSPGLENLWATGEQIIVAHIAFACEAFQPHLALAPSRLSILFIFSGGIFLKLNGRKRGSVGFLLRQEVGVIRSDASDLFY